MSCGKLPDYEPWTAEHRLVELQLSGHVNATLAAHVEKPTAPLWLLVGVQWVPRSPQVTPPNFSLDSANLYGLVRVGERLDTLSPTPLNNAGLGAEAPPFAWEGATALDGVRVELAIDTNQWGVATFAGSLRMFARAYPTGYMPAEHWAQLKQRMRIVGDTVQGPPGE